ncbi:uncharacterized protein LOC134837899 [Culicoides brevitarsis]|uniref:uncharacterized protein LOC134837899 n=1 Tax=Culicoides brevitarsis TaxID=469753 RepID=UPI00307BDBE5
MPLFIDGFEVQTRKFFAINKIGYCNWSMGHALPSGFRIGGTYQRQLSDDVLITPFCGFDINPSNLSTNFALIYYPVSQMGFEIELQAMPLTKNPDIERLKGNFVMNCNSERNNFSCSMHETGRFMISDMYKVSPRLSVGSELMLKCRGKDRGANLAFAMKYLFENKTIMAASCSFRAFDLTLYKQISPNLQVGTSFVLNSPKNYQNMALFYQWEKQNVSIRSLIDSNLTAGFTYTRLFENLSSSFCLSLYYCVLSNKFSCGFKFDLDDTFLGKFRQQMQNNYKSLSSLAQEKICSA